MDAIQTIIQVDCRKSENEGWGNALQEPCITLISGNMRIVLLRVTALQSILNETIHEIAKKKSNND